MIVNCTTPSVGQSASGKHSKVCRAPSRYVHRVARPTGTSWGLPHSRVRDQAVRVELRIPASVVALMARVGRETITRYEIDPVAVRDEAKRTRIGRVYAELRTLLERFPMQRRTP